MFEIIKTKQSNNEIYDMYFFIKSLLENNWFYPLCGIVDINDNEIYCETKREFEYLWDSKTFVI